MQKALYGIDGEVIVVDNNSVDDSVTMVKEKFPELTHFNELSMGMSNDYEVAMKEGSTMVRIGSSIFGSR